MGNMFPGFKMPIGTHKGRQIFNLPIAYILWFLATDNVRKNYPNEARAMLTVLASRLRDRWQIERELALRSADDHSDLV